MGTGNKQIARSKWWQKRTGEGLGSNEEHLLGDLGGSGGHDAETDAGEDVGVVALARNALLRVSKGTVAEEQVEKNGAWIIVQ